MKQNRSQTQKINLPLESIKNVLILMPDKHMGDLVIALPAIKALSDFFKNKNCCLVIDKVYEEIAQSLEGVQLLLYPRESVANNSLIKGTAAFLRFVRKLKSLSPDLIIDLEGRHASSWMTCLTAAPIRIGFTTAKKGFCYNKKVPSLRNGRHRVYRYMSILSYVGAQWEGFSFTSKASHAKIDSFKQKLLDRGISQEKKLVCIHPGAGRIFREWSSEGFAKVTEWLVKSGFQPFVIGGGSDVKKAEEIKSYLGMSNIFFVGELSLSELVAAFEISSFYIGNESGPLHLASTIENLPVAGFYFRPGNDKVWYPLTERHLILKGDVGCKVCEKEKCTLNYACTYKLTAEEVIEQISTRMEEWGVV